MDGLSGARRYVILLLLLTLLTCKGSEKTPTCDELFARLERNEAIDLRAASCDKLSCLRARYEAIATAKPQGTPTADEYQKAQRALKLIGQIDTVRVFEKHCK
jgi:hypothetical protein